MNALATNATTPAALALMMGALALGQTILRHALRQLPEGGATASMLSAHWLRAGAVGRRGSATGRLVRAMALVPVVAGGVSVLPAFAPTRMAT